MKKIVLIISLLFVFSVVKAESKNILVKVEEIKNVTNYTSTIKDGGASLNVDGKTLTISTNNSNNNKITIVKTSGDALKWISDINGVGNYYYVSMFDNESLINSVSIQDASFNIYDLNGNLITNDVSHYNVNLGEFYIKLNDKDQTDIKNNNEYTIINLLIEGNGKVIIDGKIYTKSTSVPLKKDSIFLFMADTDYRFSKLYFDSEDITSLVINNRYEKNKSISKDIKVIFKKNTVIESDTLINISGYVKMNGLPLQNVKLILHSKELTTVTNNDGYYEFYGVSLGNHELLVLTESNKAIGYISFNLEQNGDSTYKTINNNEQVVNVDSGFDSVNIDLVVKDDYVLDFENVDSYLKKDSNRANILWFIIPVLIVIVVIVVVVMLNKKNK